VGVALVEAGGAGITGGWQACAIQAAEWLSSRRAYPSGWGYNGITGPDADSTALALTLMRWAGLPASPADEDWLRARWQSDGGFATFDRVDAWGRAHVDVTPAAYLALGASPRAALREELIAYLLREQLPDGTWPAYWWRSNLYSTRACLELLLDLGVNDLYAWPAGGASVAIQSDFELALAAEISSLCVGPDRSRELVRHLIARQRCDGSWQGALNLRVTDPDCYTPWRHPVGRLYCDERALLTTASAVRALAKATR
jgi:squalene cyclase